MAVASLNNSTPGSHCPCYSYCCYSYCNSYIVILIPVLVIVIPVVIVIVVTLLLLFINDLGSH
jgi:hypothetical protein